MTQTEKLAAYLDEAMRDGRETARITEQFPELSVTQAYDIQAEGIRRRLARGERIIGYKMGLTSRAKREQMGLSSPVYGVLTDKMKVEGTFALKGSIHPKIEPEIGFTLKSALKGQVSTQQAMDAIGEVFPALEILDSRYVGFKYFSLPDVIADNSSSSHFVIGRGRAPEGLDFPRLQLTLKINGESRATAPASEISGNPLNSLIQLCELLGERGIELPAGAIVLTGAATAAVPLEPGMRVELEVPGLGELGVNVGN